MAFRRAAGARSRGKCVSAIWALALVPACSSRSCSWKMSGDGTPAAGPAPVRVPPTADVAVCFRCGERCYAPQWISERTRDAPRAEWKRRFAEGPRAPGDEAYLYWTAFCAPSCRANAAIRRFEAAKLEIAAALEEVQAAVVDAFAEVGEAWAEMGR